MGTRVAVCGVRRVARRSQSDARARRESDGRRRGAKRLARARGATVCRVGARLGGVTNDANPHVIHRGSSSMGDDGATTRDDARRRARAMRTLDVKDFKERARANASRETNERLTTLDSIRFRAR